jgi:hypothetical protein
MVLNPMHKWKYFTWVWKDKQGWIMTAKAAMKELWDSQYKPIPQATLISVAELAAGVTTNEGLESGRAYLCLAARRRTTASAEEASH